MKTVAKKAILMGRDSGMLVAVPEAIELSSPQEGEVITGTEYIVRVTVPREAEIVEVSINDGPWQACRCAVEYWWLDWWGFAPGSYAVRARMHDGMGRKIATLPRHFYVVDR